MRAGKLDRRVIIERPIVNVAEDGTATEHFGTLAAVRAEIVESRAEEFMRNFGASSETTTTFRVRYLPGITTADRVVYNGRPYDVKAITEIGRRRGLEIRAMARPS